MGILKKRSAIIIMFFLLFSVVSTHPQTIGDLFKKKQKAESLEDYFKRGLEGDVDYSKSIHNDAKFMVIMANQTIVVEKDRIIQLLRALKNAGATSKILEFKILNKYQTDDIISVVVKAKTITKLGKTEIIQEQIIHEIMMKRGNSFVEVFCISKQ